jgi:hypothetical protein
MRVHVRFSIDSDGDQKRKKRRRAGGSEKVRGTGTRLVAQTTDERAGTTGETTSGMVVGFEGTTGRGHRILILLIIFGVIPDRVEYRYHVM